MLGVVVTPRAVETDVGAVEADDGEVSVAVTGQIVVETATVTVVSTVELPGQLVTVAAQLVMV